MGKAKGSVLLHLRAFVEKFHGEEAWEAALGELSSDDRVVLTGLVIHGGWYPVGVWNRVLKVVLQRHYPSMDDGMRQVSQFIANADLNSVYKMVLRLGSPEFLLKRTDSLWSRYFDTGKMFHEELGPRRWKLRLDAPTDENKAPSYFTCGPGVSAWVGHGLRLTGTDARVEHIRCRMSLSGPCEYAVQW
jgi:hypothetical protein